MACGQLDDVLVLAPDIALSRANRTDVRLVLIGGEPRYADLDLVDELDVRHALMPVQVDGRFKLLARDLISALHEATVQEPGLDLHHHLLESVS